MIRLNLTFIILFLCSVAFAEPGRFGYCGICDTKVMSKVDGKLVPNSEYIERWFKFSDGTIGKVAFCKNHYYNFSTGDVEPIMNNMIAAWQEEMDKNDWTEEQKNEYMGKYGSLKIIGVIDE